MRFSSLAYVLSGLGYVAALVNSGAIPDVAGQSSVDLVDSSDLDGVTFTKINFKITRGGGKGVRDVIVTASGATVAIGTILGWIHRDSAKNSCAPIGGSGQADHGSQKYDFKYFVTTTGKNCDTTAQAKTVASALDDAWDQVHKYKYNWACIDLTHGGTWHGHLAVATVGSGQNVNTMCS